MVDFRSSAVVAVAYLLTTVFMTWPLIFHLDGFLLPGGYKDIYHSDVFLFFSHIAESREMLLAGRDLFPVYPTLSVNPTYVLPGVLATLGFGMPKAVFHNLFYLTSMFLSGVFMYWFMLELCGDRLAAFFSGFLYMSSNYVIGEYVWSHPNYLQIQWLPLIFLLVERTLKHKDVRSSVYLGVVFAIQILSAEQYMVYLSFVLPMYVLLRIFLGDRKTLQDRLFWKRVVSSILLALAFSSYYLYKKAAVHNAVRTIKTNLKPYWILASLSQLYDANSTLHIGALQLMLILAGMYVLWQNRQNTAYTKYLPFAALLIFLILCMMGPSSQYMPYYWLYKLWPFVDNMRVPNRLFPFALFCSSILSAIFLIRLKAGEKTEKIRIYVLAAALLIILLTQILASPWVTPHHIFHPGDEWIGYCRRFYAKINCTQDLIP